MPVMNAAMTLSRELSLFQPGRDRNLLVFEGPRGNLGNSLSTHFLVFNGCVCVCVCLWEEAGKTCKRHRGRPQPAGGFEARTLFV